MRAGERVGGGDVTISAPRPPVEQAGTANRTRMIEADWVVRLHVDMMVLRGLVSHIRENLMVISVETDKAMRRLQRFHNSGR